MYEYKVHPGVKPCKISKYAVMILWILVLPKMKYYHLKKMTYIKWWLSLVLKHWCVCMVTMQTWLRMNIGTDLAPCQSWECMWKCKSCWDMASRKHSPVWKNKESKHFTSHCLRCSLSWSLIVLCLLLVAITGTASLCFYCVWRILNRNVSWDFCFVTEIFLCSESCPHYFESSNWTSEVIVTSDSRVKHFNVCRNGRACLVLCVCVI